MRGRVYHPVLPNMYYVPASSRAEFLTLTMHFAQHAIYSELELSYILTLIRKVRFSLSIVSSFPAAHLTYVPFRPPGPH